MTIIFSFLLKKIDVHLFAKSIPVLMLIPFSGISSSKQEGHCKLHFLWYWRGRKSSGIIVGQFSTEAVLELRRDDCTCAYFLQQYTFI